MSILLPDYHIHTYFSGDCETSLDDIAAASIKKGLKSICITDHQDFDFYAEGILYELDKDEYYEKMCEFREKYKGRLDVRIGIETGLEPKMADRLDEFINRHNYDFVIGSSHLINGYDPYYPEYFYGKTDYEAFKEYFETIVDNIKYCKNFDVYGHIDYVVRYSPNKDENYNYMDYIDLIDEILKRLIESGKGIEINTSGYKSGLKNPNPCYEIVKRYKELGGEIITLGSDSHKSEFIAYEFERTIEKIKACGFKYYTEFKNRKPEFIKI